MKNYAGKIIAIEHLTLDGVYQGPATADEDTRNGFKLGGWSVETNTPQLQKVISRYMAKGWSLLAGRITYETLYKGWRVRQPDSDMAKALTNVQKFVVSHNKTELPWENSTLLTGSLKSAITKLKKEQDKPLIIFGSGVLTKSLIQRGLVDELLLMIHPVVAGDGYRFFDDSVPHTKFNLSGELVTDTGVIVVTYNPKQ